MMNNKAMKPDYVTEILKIFRGPHSSSELVDLISDYHENDIAEAFEALTLEERKKLYPLLGARRTAEILCYIEPEDISKYLRELGLESAAKIISCMDSDDAADILDEMEPDIAARLIALLDNDAGDDVRLIRSYDEDEVGSMITTNFIEIYRGLSIRQATKELILKAGDNDNISTIYAVESDGTYYGAIELKDLIIARENDSLEDIISTSYPYLNDHDKISACIEDIKDYAEDSLPVLNEARKLIGVITAQDIIEAVDDELSEDYAKLGGLTSEEDLYEPTRDSIRKRMPWLVVLLFLGLIVSGVVGKFEAIVAAVPIVMCFQSLILDMAGNVGTQSLAVTIRVLADEELKPGEKLHLVIKETRVGFINGLLLGLLAFIFVGIYLVILKQSPIAQAVPISACVSFSLMAAMAISSTVGTLIPIFFHAVKIDPAVASGPLITTVNDLVAVITYYGLAWILLLNVLHIA